MAISCEGGLPGEKAMRKGNIMSITMNSMRRIPSDMSKIAEEFSNSDIEVYFTLPFPDTGRSIVFPMGKYVKDLNSFDESKIDYVKSRFSTTDKQKIVSSSSAEFGDNKYWASVMESWPEAPREAAIVLDTKDNGSKNYLQSYVLKKYA